VREANEVIATHPWWQDRLAWKSGGQGPWARGTGMAVGVKGVGHGSGFVDTSGARLAISADGSIRIWAGPNHTGQFLETTYAQIAADALGRPIDDIDVMVGDTELVPPSGPSAASRGTYAGGAAVLLACEELLQRVRQLGIGSPIDWAEAGHRLTAAGEALVESRFVLPGAEGGSLSDEEVKMYSPHRVFGATAMVARVEVNRHTGEVSVLGVASAVDCGAAINPAGVIGQTEGGILQGMGFAIMEELAYRDGMPLQNSLETYLIPTASDIPEMETILIEDGEESTGPFGAKGIAEVTLVPVAPAITSAIRDAVGASVERLPATPERVFLLMRGGAA
jgi:CO/xanthine dehydrogenase Mo-binding subunit